MDVASGETRALTRRRGPDGGPVPSPDGRYIAYTGFDWSDDTYIEEGIYVMGADGSNPAPHRRRDGTSAGQYDLGRRRKRHLLHGGRFRVRRTSTSRPCPASRGR